MKSRNLLFSSLILSGLFMGVEINPTTAETIRLMDEREMAIECISIATKVYSQSNSIPQAANRNAQSFCQKGGDPYCLIKAYEHFAQGTNISNSAVRVQVVRKAENACL